jgi:transposase
LLRWAAAAPNEGAQQLALHCRIVLACADGLTNEQVAQRLGVAPSTVGRWRARFVLGRLEGLYDSPRPGPARTVSDGVVEEILERTLRTKPAHGRRWTTREMARVTGLSQSTISRIWRTFGLQPHRMVTFQPSSDRRFSDSVRGVVGLYLDPPERVVALCAVMPGTTPAGPAAVPLVPRPAGAPAQRPGEGVRAGGVTDLLASLKAGAEAVPGTPATGPRVEQVLRFLSALDERVPQALAVHLLGDQQVTHHALPVGAWLQEHPRFHIHTAPSSSSWLCQVDHWCGPLTEEQVRAGDLGWESGICAWIRSWGANPQPFTWTRTPGSPSSGDLCR